MPVEAPSSAAKATAPAAMPRISVVMACFNRRETTLRCLRSLYAQQDLAAEISVYLVDDASPDGTGDAVRQHFPDVHVLTGTGNLFWGGGMHMAMSAAAPTGADFMLWLNDDVTLHPGALAGLLAAHARATAETGSDNHIIAGAVTDPVTGKVTYAGFDRRNSYHPAQVRPVLPEPDRLVPCDSMNGNCVLIPKPVSERIGLIDGQLIHRYGDIDYGYRSTKAGGKIFIAPNPVGTCSANPPVDLAKRLAGKTLAQRWKILTGPLGTPLGPMFRLMWRHGGVVGAVMGGGTAAKLVQLAVVGGSRNSTAASSK